MLPECYKYRHSLVHNYLEYRLENIEQGQTLPITIAHRDSMLVITFYPKD